MQINPKNYLVRNIKEILDGDFIVLAHKIKKLIFLPYFLVIFLFAVLFVLLIRLLSPFLIVRLAGLDIGRIGGMYHSDLYLSEKKCGQHTTKYLDFFYLVKSTNHVNYQWIEMWKREINVFFNPLLASFIEKLNKLFPGYEKYQIPNSDMMPSIKEFNNYFSGKDLTIYEKYNKHLASILKVNTPNVSLRSEEIQLGDRLILKLGIPLNKPFICFHNRDSAFLDSVRSHNDWSYHNFRDSSIENYLSAANEMIGLGYYLVRLGEVTKEKIKNTSPKLIDYANSSMRSDFLDIYLSARCKFIICSDTGMSFPAEVFKRPLVFVNWTSILRLPIYALNGLIIFKKFYLKNENRYMSFLEIINFNFWGFDSNELFSKLGVELIENTPEEILSVTTEMNNRLNGTWKTSKEDEDLQKIFWNIFGSDRLKSRNLRIGADYLRNNTDLLKINLEKED